MTSATTGLYRLLTTLTDHRADPAAALVQLYHERWEIESAFFALRHTLLRCRVPRSKDPVGIEQGGMGPAYALPGAPARHGHRRGDALRC
ncbi:hypothetical protein [Nonomuraea jiangxiensis]|uniref:hypothetical protein n=1 Tax=Nonomuraea jiangxiensis TaxID=633440 RepID=UPI001160059D|nr:hypothetical protein [Nonomuraea jiangxiensis]